jgi:hypothetical protein
MGTGTVTVIVKGDKQRLWQAREALTMRKFSWRPRKKCYERNGVDQPLATMFIQRFNNENGLTAEMKN